ncbi:MAG: DUF839 domain-containing protein [Planctomycetes bacterium]|nr:DUF839 domain-containing protein [Planctomycetota bacterium]
MKQLALTVVAASFASLSLAAQATFPLPVPVGSPNATPPGSTNGAEGTAPFLAPLRMTQTLVVNRDTLTRTQGLPATFGLWDMSAFDPTGRYIFTPSEVSSGCGVFRYDTVTGIATTLMLGNNTGIRESNPAAWDPNNDDYSRFDPCTYTPVGTIILGEETTGGRMFEVLNPMSPNGPFQVRWLSKIPAMGHEGTRFDSQGNLYVVDENNSGCIYKFVPANPGDLSVGQSFVLRIDAYAADPNARPSENWSSAQNQLTTRVGAARWIPLTDAVGNALTTADPLAYVSTTGGRDAADEVLGTPYGRPEDLDFNVLANGNECIYCAVTSENAVLSIELTGGDTAMVRWFLDRNTIDLATGAAVGGVFASPDNVAVDAFGSIYVVEDGEPNGGDIWKAMDADKDGVAESMGVFVSLGISGSEPSGMIFDPTNPYRFIVNIQHPASGNDATWAFETRPYAGSDRDLSLASGINAAPTAGPGEFVRGADAFDTIVYHLDSPNGSLYGAQFALLVQPFVTSAGQPRFLPPLWMNLLASSFVLIGTTAGQFPIVLPSGGARIGLGVPSGVNGVSIMAQGITFDAVNGLVFSDGVETVLR